MAAGLGQLSALICVYPDGWRSNIVINSNLTATGDSYRRGRTVAIARIIDVRVELADIHHREIVVRTKDKADGHRLFRLLRTASCEKGQQEADGKSGEKLFHLHRTLPFLRRLRGVMVVWGLGELRSADFRQGLVAYH